MIQTIDLNFMGRPQCVGSFLLRKDSQAVLFECGPSTTLPKLRQELQGIEVVAVVITHIHLDHAGSAGWWTEQGIPLYVHEFGAPHMVDPSKLVASATRIYGDRMDELWGEIRPCRADMVRTVKDGDRLELLGFDVRVHETPGHARHHHAFQIGTSLIAGDVAGCRLPAADFLSVPAPPPEFDREMWLESLEKLRRLNLETLYLTHFGPVSGAGEHLAQLAGRIQAVTDFVAERREMDRDELVRQYVEWNRQHCPDEETFDRYEQANPLFMSVDGLLRYWKKRAAV